MLVENNILTKYYNMITEDYVGFETAKLLKDKGFDESCEGFYVNSGVLSHTLSNAKNSKWDEDKSTIGYISAPTLQMAMKWLREVHNQIIVPGIRLRDRTSGTINCYIAGIWYIPKNNGGAFCYTSPTPYDGYSSFEEACEAAIKYCLKYLI